MSVMSRIGRLVDTCSRAWSLFGLGDWVSDKRRSASNAAYLLKHGRGRVFMFDFGDQYLQAMAEDLETLARENHGYPIDYTPDRWLVSHDNDMEKWLDSQPYDVYGFSSDYNTYEHDGLTTYDLQKVRVIGEQAVAWSQDLLYASEVIHDYLMTGSDSDWSNTYYQVHGREAFTARLHESEEEFLRVWFWIGKNIMTIND